MTMGCDQQLARNWPTSVAAPAPAAAAAFSTYVGPTSTFSLLPRSAQYLTPSRNTPEAFAAI